MYKDPEDQRQNARRHYAANTDAYKQRARRNNQRYIARNMAFIAEFKATHGCSRCGNFYPAPAMDFHHRDPTTKTRNVSMQRSYSLERLKAEIAKCDLLCAICHRLVTHA